MTFLRQNDDYRRAAGDLPFERPNEAKAETIGQHSPELSVEPPHSMPAAALVAARGLFAPGELVYILDENQRPATVADDGTITRLEEPAPEELPPAETALEPVWSRSEEASFQAELRNVPEQQQAPAELRVGSTFQDEAGRRVQLLEDGTTKVVGSDDRGR